MISIIIPVYNVENKIRKCINSILQQTYTKWELILVNDGSHDFSGEICNDYAQMDSRIKVFHKTNGGVSSARNAGMDVARGELLAFVDSDDWIEPEMYQKLIELMIEQKADWSCCAYRRVAEKGMEDFSDNHVRIFSRNELMDTYIRATKGKYIFTMTDEYIRISVNVTNKHGIVY